MMRIDRGGTRGRRKGSVATDAMRGMGRRGTRGRRTVDARGGRYVRFTCEEKTCDGVHRGYDSEGETTKEEGVRHFGMARRERR